jgi:ATP-dependent DNA helicase RecG
MLKLSSKVTNIPKIGPKYEFLLSKLGIITIKDLIYHIPFRYDDFSKVKKINELKSNELVSVDARLISINNIFTRNKKRLTKAIIQDETGKSEAIWFNMHYLSKSLEIGEIYRFTGKAEASGSKVTLLAPTQQKINTEDTGGEILGVYPETEGVNSKFLRDKVKFALENVEIEEFLPEKILNKYNFKNLSETLNEIHFPKSVEDQENFLKRLEFEEIFLELLKVEERKLKWGEKLNSHPIKHFPEEIEKLKNNLPFKLTETQDKAINEIFEDLNKPNPMNRLLEGDVGTGKTMVAVFASYLTVLNGFKVFYLAPTEILAKQHFESFKKILEPLGIKIVLKTGSTKLKLKENEFDICIGTHAILFDFEDIPNVSLVIVDEQHRFGVEQRSKILNIYNQEVVPNLLTMTATPIPRTFALTLYGDLDISILDAPPNKDKKITTYVIYPNKRDDMYNWINERNESAFIVCPFINESEAEEFAQVKSATTEYEILRQGIFKNRKVGLLHGKMKPAEKEEILGNFRNGEIEILVSTPVIEVGVDIPDANIIVIESAERYGLASLHQLRGRVGRGVKEGFCIVIPSTGSKSSMERLKNLEKYSNGLELAEIDLKIRGEGDVTGRMQSGFKNFKFADLTNLKLLEKAKKEAAEYIKEIENYPILKSHFERINNQNIWNN